MQNHIIFSRNKQVQSGWDGRFGTFTFFTCLTAIVRSSVQVEIEEEMAA